MSDLRYEISDIRHRTLFYRLKIGLLESWKVRTLMHKSKIQNPKFNIQNSPPPCPLCIRCVAVVYRTLNQEPILQTAGFRIHTSEIVNIGPLTISMLKTI